jgi:hypothetical protein
MGESGLKRKRIHVKYITGHDLQKVQKSSPKNIGVFSKYLLQV